MEEGHLEEPAYLYHDERKATRASTSGSLIEGYGGCGRLFRSPVCIWCGETRLKSLTIRESNVY